jgi:hypothetical protein
MFHNAVGAVQPAKLSHRMVRVAINPLFLVCRTQLQGVSLRRELLSLSMNCAGAKSP